MTDYGFRELGLHRISAAIGPDNAASIALVQKLGFSYEGRIRDHVHTNGAWRDSLLFSISQRGMDEHCCTSRPPLCRNQPVMR